MNSSIPHKWRAVKPAVCDSRVLRHPIAPCEILPRGLEGLLVINETSYAVEALGYLPIEGEPIVQGFRLTKADGTTHDLCLVAGRLECTCGDWIWRRAALADPQLADCKHCIACKRHFAPPVDQKPARKPVLTAADFEGFDDP